MCIRDSVHPLQVVRTRLSMSGNHYNGIAHCVTQIARTQGPSAFYTGLMPTLLSGTPYISLQLTFHYGVFKPLMPQLGLDGPIASGVSGLLSNLCAQFVTFPGETVRNRMITDGVGKPPEYGGSMMRCVSLTLKKEGVRGFFKGYGANAVRAFPASILQFMIYDESKVFFQRMLMPGE
eukprot:TRINITY_DN31264_c0_g1_i2.p2 TRINITY_DN31264_c0_g1~~TRINITY_DN31264_c0_g1_i2.p2  ORF type:complete len:178 (-),score=32.55 TRINITY_DN31264_c0_g1_i2:239-772(-)